METLKGYMFSSNQMCPCLHLTHPKANILIRKDRRACLADFGLSTITGVATRVAAGASQASLISNDSLTPLIAGASRMSLISDDSLMSFTVGGTCRWMSPELLDPELFGVQGDRPTRQSDCYALGMVIYEVRVRGSPSTVENS
jgi:serine/threonine protein kinase